MYVKCVNVTEIDSAELEKFDLHEGDVYEVSVEASRLLETPAASCTLINIKKLNGKQLTGRWYAYRFKEVSNVEALIAIGKYREGR